MIKKTVTYEDFNGAMKTEDLHFHLTKAEAIEFSAEMQDMLRAPLTGLKPATEEQLTAAISAADSTTMMALIRRLITKAYGVRTEDGGFMKSPQIAEQFSYSPAYSEIFCAMVSDPDAANAFIKALIPQQLAKPAGAPAA